MINLLEEEFGVFTDKSNGESKIVKKFTFLNENNYSVEVITYGATITSIKCPDLKGDIQDIVTGFSNIDEYLSQNNPYFGATIGRVANRIGFGKLNSIDPNIEVSKNQGEHQLHGGFISFDKVLWEPYVNGTTLVLSYMSPDLEEGYPGALVVNISFELTGSNEFLIKFKASTTKPTYVNLTNHSYFNLAGHNRGPNEIYKHLICINANNYTEIDSDSIPTGTVLPVDGTVFDFQVPKILGTVINNVPNMPGFDHNFCIKNVSTNEATFIARAIHPSSGRTLEVFSNQPGVQFYTANFFPEDQKNVKNKSNEVFLSGKGTNYFKHGAFCFESQNWPDAPNHENFPQNNLYPGELYIHNLIYKFSVTNICCT